MVTNMYHIIVNPASKSGLGYKKWLELETELKKRNITYVVHFTKHTWDAKKYTQQLNSTKQDPLMRILVLGGDGTMNEVLNGVTDFDNTILTYLPSGSSNDLARNLHLSNDSFLALERLVQTSKSMYMDFGSVQFKGESRRFFVSCGIGFDASICEETGRSKLKSLFNHIGMGKLVYAAIGLKQLMFYKKVNCEIQIDQGPPMKFDNILFAASMIHRYEGGGAMFCPNADFHDGLIDVCLVQSSNLFKTLRLFPLAFTGKHIGSKEVHQFRGKEIIIKTSSNMWVHTDGEVLGKTHKLAIRCHQDKLYYQ